MILSRGFWGALSTTQHNHRSRGSGGESEGRRTPAHVHTGYHMSQRSEGQRGYHPQGPLSREMMFKLRLTSWPAPPQRPRAQHLVPLQASPFASSPASLVPPALGWWLPWVPISPRYLVAPCCLLGSQYLVSSYITRSLLKEPGCFPFSTILEERASAGQGAEGGAVPAEAPAWPKAMRLEGARHIPEAEGGGGLEGVNGVAGRRR